MGGEGREIRHFSPRHTLQDSQDFQRQKLAGEGRARSARGSSSTTDCVLVLLKLELVKL